MLGTKVPNVSFQTLQLCCFYFEIRYLPRCVREPWLKPGLSLKVSARKAKLAMLTPRCRRVSWRMSCFWIENRTSSEVLQTQAYQSLTTTVETSFVISPKLPWGEKSRFFSWWGPVQECLQWCGSEKKRTFDEEVSLCRHAVTDWASAEQCDQLGLFYCGFENCHVRDCAQLRGTLADLLDTMEKLAAVLQSQTGTRR